MKITIEILSSLIVTLMLASSCAGPVSSISDDSLTPIGASSVGFGDAIAIKGRIFIKNVDVMAPSDAVMTKNKSFLIDADNFEEGKKENRPWGGNYWLYESEGSEFYNYNDNPYRSFPVYYAGSLESAETIYLCGQFFHAGMQIVGYTLSGSEVGSATKIVRIENI